MSKSESQHARGGSCAENAFGAKRNIDAEVERIFRLNPVLIQENGCWHFGGPIGNRGYGNVWVRREDGKNQAFLAHRVAYHIFHGSIPEGLLVCHACDNRKCVNPKHLFLGTNDENLADFFKKGYRKRHADKIRKITPEIAEQIRERLRAGVSAQSIADAVGFSSTTVRRIRNQMSERGPS